MEIVGEIKDIQNKIEIDENLFENMESKRKYTEDEIKAIYKTK